MPRLIDSLLMIAVAGILGSCAAPPVRTSLCEIIANGSKYEGRLVEVSGAILTDGQHGSWIEDASCGDGVGFDAESGVVSDRLFQAINPMIPGVGFDRALVGTVVGRYELERDKRVLTASSVDVRVARRPAVQLRCPGGQAPVAALHASALAIAERVVAEHTRGQPDDGYRWTTTLVGEYERVWSVYQTPSGHGAENLKGGGRPEFDIDKCSGEVTRLSLSK